MRVVFLVLLLAVAVVVALVVWWMLRLARRDAQVRSRDAQQSSSYLTDEDREWIARQERLGGHPTGGPEPGPDREP